MTLAQYMELRGMTDAQVAAVIDVHQTTITRLRLGSTFPNGKMVKKILDWSGGAVTADDLHAAYVAAQSRTIETPEAERFSPEAAE